MTWLVTHGVDTEVAVTTSQDDRRLFLERHPPGQQQPDVLCMSKTPPRVMVSHLPIRFLQEQRTNSGTKVIVIIRDLKDTLVSNFNHYKDMQTISYGGSWDKFFELFKKQELFYGDWGEFYEGWWQQKDDPNFLFLRYEDMKKHPAAGIRRITTHCDKALSQDQVDNIVKCTSFDEMSNNPVLAHPRNKNYYRKGKVGDWQNYFSAEQVSYIEEYEKGLGWFGEV